MTFRQVVKYKRKNMVNLKPSQTPERTIVEAREKKEVVEPKKNNTGKKKEEMNEKVNKAEEIMNNMMAADNVKVLKKDKGLIERTESSKIVLTEDNRQVLND